jgi:thioredoxin:protein disulfide reductase
MKTYISTRLSALTYASVFLCTCIFLPIFSAAAPRAPFTEMAPQTRAVATTAGPQSSAETCSRSGTGWFKEQISCLVEHTKNPLLRLLFIFLLGILMSLTPCIYPMIPITIGILQASAQKSMLRNILAALCYTLGIAVTFALLGLLAATGGAQFGHLLSNPIVIIALVLFLGYFGFAMLGLYELRLPTFLQQGPDGVKNNSLISIFLFGAISGTVASPCLSPGLVLLLSIAATIGSKLVGFLYLFIFGVGLCVPLLIIGLFSNSMSMLPRAGIWMIEVKRIFGVLLIAMCFYYLTPLMHGCLLRGILAGTLVTTGIFFFTLDGTTLRWYRRIVGILLIAVGVYAAVDAVRYWRCPPTDPIRALSYDDAKKQGIVEHKKLLVDFGASWCASCREIEKKVMHNMAIHEQLPQIIFVEIDGTDPHNPCCAELSKKYSVIGFPVVLLIEPETEKVIARWGEEFASMTQEKIISTIQKALA